MKHPDSIPTFPKLGSVTVIGPARCQDSHILHPTPTPGCSDWNIASLTQPAMQCLVQWGGGIKWKIYKESLNITLNDQKWFECWDNVAISLNFHFPKETPRILYKCLRKFLLHLKNS